VQIDTTQVQGAIFSAFYASAHVLRLGSATIILARYYSKVVLRICIFVAEKGVLINWRVSSSSSSAIPLVYFAIPFLRSLSPTKFDKLRPFVLTIYVTLIFIYVLARLIIISMLFTTLRALPIRSYIMVDFIEAIPHV
jgi:hypothetical protein